MTKLIVLLFVIVLALGTVVALYLLIRHFHRKWRWQDRVNANTITQASLDDATCEVLPDGQVRHTGRLKIDHLRQQEKIGRMP